MKKHLFSFYTENIAKENKKIIIKKENPLFHRLTQVLRYKINEQCILFDHHSYYCLKIESIEKDKITSLIEQQNLIISEDKKIIAYIPLIEKDYLSKVLYTCGQIGIKDIFFVKTDRSHIKNIEAYDIERLEKIMIAGCEQARQYRIPKIHSQVITIKDIIYDNFYFFSEKGNKNITDIIPLKSEEIRFFCGPEAGFSEEEEQFLLEKSNSNIHLGKSILRSCDILIFAATFFKSLIS